MKKHFFNSLSLFVLLWGCLVPVVLFSQTAAPGDITGALNRFVEPTGVEQSTLQEAAGKSLELVYQLTGLIFFILAVYAGLLWLTAAGNEDSVKKARNILIAATVGLAVIVSAYAITQFITERAVRELAGGGASTIPDGAGGGSGSLETQQGCCVYNNSVRGTFGVINRNFASYITTEGQCQVEAGEAGAIKRGDGIHADEQWNFYPEITDIRTCQQMDSCWENSNDASRTSCISTIISD